MSIDGLGDDEVRALLKRVKTFAVVGASAKPERPSYGVMKFLLDHGYDVKPVNPGLAGQTLHGRVVSSDLASVNPPVDVVDIFRTPDAALGVVREAIAVKDTLGIAVIWMQLGVINEEAARLAREHGFTVVMDRCPVIEFRRLKLG
jgi:predicted CoA-binding protein